MQKILGCEAKYVAIALVRIVGAQIRLKTTTQASRIQKGLQR